MSKTLNVLHQYNYNILFSTVKSVEDLKQGNHRLTLIFPDDFDFFSSMVTDCRATGKKTAVYLLYYFK